MIKRLFSIFFCLSLLICALPAALAADGNASFTDVKEGDWYYDSVGYMVKTGLMRGIGPDSFDPGGTVTRAMLVPILYRLEGEPAVEHLSQFRDVPQDSYYAPAVAWASENGIVSGYSNYAFGPDDSITREQLALILYRYADRQGYDLTEKAELSVYTDFHEVSTYAVDAMGWANGGGIITGGEGMTLQPQRSATRAEVAVILVRFLSDHFEALTLQPGPIGEEPIPVPKPVRETI